MDPDKSKVQLVIKQGQSFFKCFDQYYYNGGKRVNQSESEKLSVELNEIVVSTNELLKQNFSSEPILLELIHKTIRPCNKIWVIYTHKGHNGINADGKYQVNLHPLPGQEIPYPILEYRISAYNYIMIPDESQIQDSVAPLVISRIHHESYQFGFISNLECIFDRSMYSDYGYQSLENLYEIDYSIVEWVK